MMLKPCEKHSSAINALVSPYLFKAVAQGSKINRKEQRFIRVEGEGGFSRFVVDKDFFEKYFPDAKENSVVLRDRNIKLKQLNDRVLIVKIEKELRLVCSECLEEIFYSDNE